MRCSRAKKHLAEYIKGTIDPKLQEEIKAHILKCERCEKELHELQDYFRTISNLKQVSPPSDFLEKVHARIETAEKEEISFWKILIKKLFSPIYIKLPLELIGASIAVLIVIFFYGDRFQGINKFNKPQKAAPQYLALKERELPSEKQLSKNLEDILVKGISKQKLEMKRRQGREELDLANPKEIRLTLLVKTRREQLPLVLQAPVSPEKKAAISEDKRCEVYKRDNKAKIKMRKPEGNQWEESKDNSNKVSKELIPKLDKIREITNEVKGIFVSKSIKKGPSKIIIVIKIPSQNISLFLDKLKGIGEVKNLPLPIPLSSDKMTNIKITIKATNSLAR